MTLTDLFDKIAEREDMEGIGIQDTDKGPILFVRYKPSNTAVGFPAAAVAETTWPAIERTIVEQEPEVLRHMTRVVGYYSRISNWNRSKVGELKDRHKGQYAIKDEEQPAIST